MRRIVLVLAIVVPIHAALAQDPMAMLKDDIPMDVYLDALTQISPAAREGAETYVAVFRRRCGRTLTTVELRRAVADGTGEPVLMAMMRAAFQSDHATLSRLSNSVSCIGEKDQ